MDISIKPVAAAKPLSVLIPLTFFLLLWCPFQLTAQDGVSPTSPEEHTRAIERHDSMRTHSVFQDYPVRNVGPEVMGGRITDIAVHPDTFATYYIGYASGGVFRTTNNGLTQTPVFDSQGSLTTGDIAVSAADPQTVWVGTGENNSSRSSYAGAGVYKSSDGGRSWEYVGLRGTQHIGRIMTHPQHPDTAWVASMGPLYSNNSTGGVYKTTDGGDSWEQSLHLTDSTGVIDLMVHPDDPSRLWATTWERSREAWNFKENGKGSGIYYSSDGGQSWTPQLDGLPDREHLGRIGIDISPTNPDILYAIVDNQKQDTVETSEEDRKDRYTQQTFTDITKKEFLELDDEKLQSFLRRNGFPERYTAQQVKVDVKKGKYDPQALAEYLGDANEALFDTEVKGAQVYRSENGGQSWEQVNEQKLEGLYYTYGYYFGEIRVDPQNPDVVYAMGVPLLKSTDGGKHWKPIAEAEDVHVDHHAMWINPKTPDNLLLGNDGGLYVSYDGGEHFTHRNNAPVGQFYSVAVDMETPYNIYGGLQDNGVYYGSSQPGSNGEYGTWEKLLGGDGMHVAVDPRNSNRVYTGFQFGNYFRILQKPAKDERQMESIKAKHRIGETPYRYNWNTPIEMSPHNSDILYFGSQKLNRSMDRGDHWTTISPDLTQDRPNGNVPYSTLTTISESPLEFGLIWVGTDDGNLQLTQDGGHSWTKVSQTLPDRRWISEVFASPHSKSSAFVSLTGYRFDEFEDYIYKTDDFGETWTDITGNLPAEAVNVIKQDHRHENLLYCGTDQGAYVSCNGGDQWHLLNDVPNTATYDMVVHPTESDLVVGTHGRSIYVADLLPIYKLMNEDRLKAPVTLFEPDTMSYNENWGKRPVPYREKREPHLKLRFHAYMETPGKKEDYSLTILNSGNETLIEKNLTAHTGFNSEDLILKKTAATGEDTKSGSGYLTPGTYTIQLRTDDGDHQHKTNLVIKK